MSTGVRRPSILRSPLGIAACIGVGLLLVTAAVAPEVLSDRAERADVAAMHEGPSAAHWLGTDALGRDVLARVLVATRMSVLLALLATLLGTAAGVVLGCLPLVLGRRLSRLVVGGIDLAVSFPGLLVALFLAVIFGVGATGAVIALSVAMVPNCARLTHTLTASVAASNYVAAARGLGVGPVTLVRRHVVPNIAEPLLITTAGTTGSMLLSFAGLSYLGFGVQAPHFDWGRLLNEGLPEIYVNPAAALGPGCAIVLAGLVFSVVGEFGAQSVDRRPPAGQPARAAGPAADPALPVPPREAEPVLEVRNLDVAFDTGAVAVRGFSLVGWRGEVVGLVGESGSGKTVTAMAIADLLPPSAERRADRIAIDGQDTLQLTRRARRGWLATRLGLVFQNPMTALNPAIAIGKQVVETLHGRGLSRRELGDRAIESLRQVRIPAAAVRARQRPHQLSGGMRQRAVIAMGIINEPSVVIADEPTTALDVSLQKQVLGLIEEARDRSDAAVLLITHDLGVVTAVATRVVVMYGGRIMEELPVDMLLSQPAHPYTAALVDAVPDLGLDISQELPTIDGRPPSAADVLPGCPFAPRCPRADERCHRELPKLVGYRDQRRVACWKPLVELPAPEVPAPVGGEAS